jgi:peptidoglycan/LPS O-acetylase OafA/YrhL
MKYIHSLTGLRGLAALVVFISHSANESLLPDFLGHGFGKVGVMLFFVLSGFLMSHLYISEDFTFKHVAKYAIARIGRVVPLYFAMILISIVISKYLYHDFYYQFPDIRTIALACSFIKAPSVFWTIPVEVQFYVVFLGLWFVNKKLSRSYLLVTFILYSFVRILFLRSETLRLPEFITLYAYAFFVGVITALFYKRIRNSVIVHKCASVLAIPIALLFFLNLPVLRERHGILIGDGLHLNIWNDPITWAIIYLLFICAMLNVKGLFFLNTKPFVLLGNISYGFYLMHYPILMSFSNLNIHPVIQLVLAFSLTTILAHFSYKYFELYVSRKVRSWIV